MGSAMIQLSEKQLQVGEKWSLAVIERRPSKLEAQVVTTRPTVISAALSGLMAFVSVLKRVTVKQTYKTGTAEVGAPIKAQKV